jgi:hypothetical protein
VNKFQIFLLDMTNQKGNSRLFWASRPSQTNATWRLEQGALGDRTFALVHTLRPSISSYLNPPIYVGKIALANSTRSLLNAPTGRGSIAQAEGPLARHNPN